MGAAAVVGLVLGCATPDVTPLLEQSKLNAKAREYERCHALALEAAAAGPSADQQMQAFELGSFCHQKLYFRDRPVGNVVIDSPWPTRELTAMFQWAETFFQGDEYPAKAVDTLLVGYPYAVFAQFKEFAAERPEMARYPMRAQVDNGIIERVSIGDEPGLRD